MRHFYKLLAGPPNTPLMTEIMQTQADLFDDSGLCKTLPSDAKKMALGILQLTNGTALISAGIYRIDHNGKLPIAPTDDGRYLAPLSGQTMCLIGDECPALNAGEIWWLDSKLDAIIVNKSGDDAILLNVVVRTR